MIHLGFEIRTGAAVEIPAEHMAITGQSQHSGKTTTLEGLIDRAGNRAIAFVTKRGESSFRVASPIPPYFRDRTDWPFIAAILEATVSEKLKFQRAEIIKLCQDYAGPEGKWKAPKTLAQVGQNAESALLKARGMTARVYTELAEYLRMIVPQIDRLGASNSLDLAHGLNVMNLVNFDFPLQALIVRSVIEWVRQRGRQTIIVIPEAWKFAPRRRGSPVRMEAEEHIREGAALGNFIWLDSQDLAGISSVLLRQVTVWLFGVQRDAHEIKRTLDYIPTDTAKPTRQEIATLGKGQFIVCWGKEMRRVYVQPAWMRRAHAEAIARGEEPIESARAIAEDYDQEHRP